MRIRAQITVDIDADDFVEAAQHQVRFQKVFSDVQNQYGQAQLVLREYRGRPGRRSLPFTGAPEPVRRATGRFSQYEND